jgi:hypothetical protein
VFRELTCSSEVIELFLRWLHQTMPSTNTYCQQQEDVLAVSKKTYRPTTAGRIGFVKDSLVKENDGWTPQ